MTIQKFLNLMILTGSISGVGLQKIIVDTIGLKPVYPEMPESFAG